MDDPNPNRKNLVVTSLMFILYYVGGGSFDGSINLQVINLKFQNTWALAGIAWVALFWFWIRFKQTYPWNFVHNFNESYRPLRSSRVLIWYISRETGSNYKTKAETGFTIGKTGISNSKMIVEPINWKNGIDNGEIFAKHKPESATRPLDITYAWCGLLPLWLVISATIKHEGIGSFVVPHVMFYFAVSLGIINTIIPNVIFMIWLQTI